MKDYSRLLEGERVFIITGVRGVGEDIALLFAQQGTQVGVGGRSPESLVKAMEEIRVYSPGSKGYVVELPSKEQVGQTTGQMFEDVQGVNILVSTVGVNVYGRIDERNGEPPERTPEINYKSGFRFSRRFIPGMMERRYGIIINILSIHSVAAMPGFGVYTGTKGAMNTTARTTALNYADYGTRVNTTCLGLTMSDNMMDEIYGYQEGPERDAFMEMLNRMQPLAPGKMEDTSDTTLYLASGTSSYVISQIIMVDGGASIKAH